MHARTLIVAAVMTGIWAAACSKPTSENSKSNETGAAQSAPEIFLVDRAGTDTPLVSELEVGRDPKLALVGPAERKVPEPRARRNVSAAASSSHVHAAVPTAELVPEMGRTSIALASAPENLPAASMPATPAGEVYGSGGDGVAPLPAEGNRGPVIIIRGGRGGPLDDCAIHGRGGHGGPGIAINRSVPGFGGGAMVNERAPRLGGSGRSGFPRGGIR
ncbi:MAG TPA: hypothetical protein VGA78_01030 [Gemmatimonadales bacterium]